MLFDGFSQLAQCRLVKKPPRLLWIRGNFRNSDVFQARNLIVLLGGRVKCLVNQIRWNQRFKSSAQTLFHLLVLSTISLASAL